MTNSEGDMTMVERVILRDCITPEHFVCAHTTLKQMRSYGPEQTTFACRFVDGETFFAVKNKASVTVYRTTDTALSTPEGN